MPNLGVKKETHPASKVSHNSEADTGSRFWGASSDRQVLPGVISLVSPSELLTCDSSTTTDHLRSCIIEMDMKYACNFQMPTLSLLIPTSVLTVAPS
ncbi:hypothetical protein WG66_008353 [Moniliophthora roreri]|nr:hypothetical protein WG66_008353 [Moniliophthora roreri]